MVDMAATAGTVAFGWDGVADRKSSHIHGRAAVRFEDSWYRRSRGARGRRSGAFCVPKTVRFSILWVIRNCVWSYDRGGLLPRQSGFFLGQSVMSLKLRQCPVMAPSLTVGLLTLSLVSMNDFFIQVDRLTDTTTRLRIS